MENKERNYVGYIAKRKLTSEYVQVLAKGREQLLCRVLTPTKLAGKNKTTDKVYFYPFELEMCEEIGCVPELSNPQQGEKVYRVIDMNTELFYLRKGREEHEFRDVNNNIIYLNLNEVCRSEK